MTHSIQKKTFHIQCSNESLANQLYPQISGLSEFKLLPLIEKIVDELCPKDKVIRLEHLRVDLGDIPLGYWEEEVVFRFEQEFRRALEEALGAIQVKGNSPDKVLDDVQSGLALLQYILENGTYPWWAESSWALIRENDQDTLSFLKLYDILWQREYAQVLALLRRYYHKKVILLRLIRQVPENRLWEIIRNLVPYDLFFLKSLWAELNYLFEKINPNRLSYKTFYETFWTRLLSFLLRLTSKLTDSQKKTLKTELFQIFGFFDVPALLLGKYSPHQFSSSLSNDVLEALIQSYWESRWPQKKATLDDFVRASQSTFKKLSRKDIWLAILHRIQVDYPLDVKGAEVWKDIFLDVLLLSPLDTIKGELLELSTRIPALGDVLKELDDFQKALPERLDSLAESIQDAMVAIIEGLAGIKKLSINDVQASTFLISFLNDEQFPPYGTPELKYLAILSPKQIDSKTKRRLKAALKLEKKVFLPKLKQLLTAPIARRNFILLLDNEQLHFLAMHLSKPWEAWGSRLFQEIRLFRSKFLSSYLPEQQLKQIFWTAVFEQLSVPKEITSSQNAQESLIDQLMNLLALAVPVSDVKFWKALNQGLTQSDFKLLSRYTRISKETIAKKGEQKIIREIWKQSDTLEDFLETYQTESFPKLVRAIAPVISDIYIQLFVITQDIPEARKDFARLIWENLWENRAFNTTKKHLEALIKKVIRHQKTSSGAFERANKLLMAQSDIRKTIISLTQSLIVFVQTQTDATPALIAWAEEIPELKQSLIEITERHPEFVDNNAVLRQWINQKIQQDPWWKERSRLIKEQEKLPMVPGSSSPSMEDIMYIHNAGLILVHPFLRRLFTLLGFTEKNQFMSSEEQYKAVHVLQYLVNKHLEVDEPSLILNKILCGLDVEEPVPVDIVLREEEKEICDKMLVGLIQQWTILKGVTPDSLRAAFFIRPGRLRYEFEHWELIVEKKGIDVLLEHLPWSISAIQLHWMKDVIHVIWA